MIKSSSAHVLFLPARTTRALWEPECESCGRKVKIIRNRGHRLWWTNLNDLRCGFEVEMTEEEHSATLNGEWNARHGS